MIASVIAYLIASFVIAYMFASFVTAYLITLFVRERENDLFPKRIKF